MREVGGASAREDHGALKAAVNWSKRTGLVTSCAILLVTAAILVLRRGTGWSETEWTILIGLPLVPLTVLTAISAAALMGLNGILSGQLPLQLIRPGLFGLSLLGLVVLHLRADPPTAMGLNLGATAIAFIMATLWLRRALPEGAAVRAPNQRSWLLSSISMAAIDALGTLQGQIGVVFLGLLATSTDAGIFRVAASAALIVSLPITMVETVSSPQFARSFGASDQRSMQRLASRSVQIGFATFAVATIAAFLFGKPLIALLFGDAYLPAFQPFIILCLARGTNALFGMNSGLLMMTGRERKLAAALALALAANLALAAVLTPVLGANGPALGSLGYFLVWNVIAWRDAKRSMNVGTALWDSLSPRLR
jgi:O-antigen/teichoic acid export membrane protein